MNEVDAWIYLDGPEPAHVRTFLDALRELPPAAPEDEARVEEEVTAHPPSLVRPVAEAPRAALRYDPT